jgi:hypothetical protein
MDDVDFWRLCDELTVVQAALLVVGHDPSPLEIGVDRKTSANQPRGYNATKNAILSAVKNDLLEGELVCTQGNINEEPYVCPSSSTVRVEDLKRWLRSKGFERHFFFFPEGVDGEFLDEDHPRYSPKLAAAVRAWEALEDDGLLKATTPKKAVQKWLRINAMDFDLCDSEGKPVESAVEEISKVVNWNPKGGAPSTPRAGLSPKKSTKATRLSVVKPVAAENSNFPPPILADEIPF